MHTTDVNTTTRAVKVGDPLEKAKETKVKPNASRDWHAIPETSTQVINQETSQYQRYTRALTADSSREPLDGNEQSTHTMAGSCHLTLALLAETQANSPKLFLKYMLNWVFLFFFFSFGFFFYPFSSLFPTHNPGAVVGRAAERPAR